MITLIMGVSQDDFVARSQDDDLKWLGKEDRQIFKMLTMQSDYCIAGRKTFEYLPKLKNRNVYCASRNTNIKEALRIDSQSGNNIYCLGGQEFTKSLMDADMIDRIYICRSKRYCFEGIKFNLDLSLYHLVDTFKFVETEVDFYR